MTRHAEPVMGTVVSFAIRRAPGSHPAALAEAVGWLHHVDAVFSTYRPDSVISRLARGETDLAACPEEVTEVLALCARAERDTGGYFTLTPHGGLDPTGLVKGWAVERASDLLTAAGAPEHCVNGGGDVQLGTGDWRIGVAHPLHPATLATVIPCADGPRRAVATSGTGERGLHVVDPHTGRPATELASITLVGERLALVDAYATAALAMGAAARDWVESMPDLEAFAVTPAGDTWRTGGFQGYR